MKNLLNSILIGLLIGNTAFAGLPPTTIKGQSDASPKTKFSFQVPYNQFTDLGGVKALVETGNKNVLTNASFEHSTYSTGWTITTASGAVETSNVKDGKQSAKLTFSASTGDIAQSVTPTINTNSQNWEASCQVKTTVPTISVCAIVNGVEQCPTTNNVAASGAWNMGTMNFIGPTDGQSVGVRVKTTASATGTVYVDDCYVGPARNLSQVSQAQLLGTVTISGCSSNWTASQTTFASDYASNSTCVYTISGQAVADTAFGTTQLPAIKFSSIAPGELLLMADGTFAQTVQATVAQFQFTDGTNFASEASPIYSGSGGAMISPTIAQRIAYTTSQSNVTLRIRGKTGSGGSAQIQSTSPLVIKVYYFPSQSQTALRPDATPASWSGYQTTSGGCSTGSTTYTDPAACTSIATTQITARNITCSQSGTGTAISCNLARTGTHTICAYPVVANSASGTPSVRLIDGSSTVINPGLSTSITTAGAVTTFPVCGKYNATNISSPIVFKAQLATNTGTASFSNGSASGSAAVQWTVDEGDAPMSAPYLVGSVTSNTSGQLRAEYVQVGGASANTACTASPCTVYGQSSPWFSNVTRSAVGNYTVNIAAGMFSGTPVCASATSNGALLARIDSNTSTAVNVVTLGSNSATGADGTFSLICMGPR